MGLPRFIGIVEDEQFYLKDEELHHAKVRRIKKGHKIEINDLKGNIYLGVVEEINKNFLKGKIVQKIPAVEDELSIELFLGMPNRLSKIDDLIEPITQLGVKTLIPVITHNTAVKKKDVLKKIDKWKKISLNSIKQCKRLYPVDIKNPVYVSQIKPSSKIRLLFYEKEKRKTLKDLKLEKAADVSVYIGAEGGITEDELKTLMEKGFIPLTLGNYILKMETAVITGICQVNFALR